MVFQHKRRLENLHISAPVPPAKFSKFQEFLKKEIKIKQKTQKENILKRTQVSSLIIPFDLIFLKFNCVFF